MAVIKTTSKQLREERVLFTPTSCSSSLRQELRQKPRGHDVHRLAPLGLLRLPFYVPQGHLPRGSTIADEQGPPTSNAPPTSPPASCSRSHPSKPHPSSAFRVRPFPQGQALTAWTSSIQNCEEIKLFFFFTSSSPLTIHY